MTLRPPMSCGDPSKCSLIDSGRKVGTFCRSTLVSSDWWPKERGALCDFLPFFTVRETHFLLHSCNAMPDHKSFIVENIPAIT